MIARIKRILKDPARIVLWCLREEYTRWISDEKYLKLLYFLHMKKRLDLDNPKSFTEKMQWLKMNYRRACMTDMVDKVLVKGIVADRVPELKVIPTLGVWKTYEEIDFNSLPNQFVLKPNHTSGNVFICKDKSKINHEELKKTVDAWLKRQYYWGQREWPYKNVKPCILAEKYMVDESGYELKDYKFFCFDGEPKLFFVATDRTTDTRFDFFDMDFNHLPFKNGHEFAEKEIKKPENFELMKEMASKLSEGFPHLRIDFYNINGDIYFGEYTFFHWSGFVPFDPDEWDYKLGEWMKLPPKTIDS